MPVIPRAARGFTLVEMLVALAVMVLAMAMVTVVFSITTKTAAESAAVADVETVLRNAADELRQDLENCDPAKSILVIHGRTQLASLTEDERVVKQYHRFLVGDPTAIDSTQDPRFVTPAPPQYSDPRADILMFFTNRPSVSRAPARYPNTGIGPSYAYDEFQRGLQRGIEHDLVQVVYGHAAIAPAVQSGGVWGVGNLTYIETDDTVNIPSSLPLTRWQLARRATLIFDPGNITGPDTNEPSAFSNLDSKSIILGYRNDTRYAADAAIFRMQRFLDTISPRLTNFSGAYGGLATFSPYLFSDSSTLPAPYNILRWSNRISPRNLIQDLIFEPGTVDPPRHHVASIIENPPTELASNINLRLAPGCVWFKVEILIPEDPRNSRQSPLSNQRNETPRWVEVEDGMTYCFVPDSEENRELVRAQINLNPLSSISGQPIADSRLSTFARVWPQNGDISGINYGGSDTVGNRIVRMWPYAIRVTMRAIDPNARIKDPITRSVVHWFE